VAGGPLDANVIKCQLKVPDAKDYPGPFTASELQRLRAIFPSGVCDWSKPGRGSDARPAPGVVRPGAGKPRV